MNKVILMGRLTRDPDIRYSAGENATAVARYTLAVDRRFRWTESRLRILSVASLLEEVRNLQRNISTREYASL